MMNLGSLKGYFIGGLFYIIINNRIGFIIEFIDGCLIMYFFDVVKGYDVLILYVNVDDVEVIIEVIEIVMEFCKEFYKDVVIDLVGYCCYGYNEMDEFFIINLVLY